MQLQTQKAPSFSVVWETLKAIVSEELQIPTLGKLQKPNTFMRLSEVDGFRLVTEKTPKDRFNVLGRSLYESAWRDLTTKGVISPEKLTRKRHSSAVLALMSKLPFVKHADGDPLVLILDPLHMGSLVNQTWGKTPACE